MVCYRECITEPDFISDQPIFIEKLFLFLGCPTSCIRSSRIEEFRLSSDVWINKQIKSGKISFEQRRVSLNTVYIIMVLLPP